MRSFAHLVVVACLALSCASPPKAKPTDVTERGLRRVDDNQAEPGRVFRMWAVVIGVSEYSFTKQGVPNLEYAEIDARSVAAALTDPRFGAGGIPKEQIRVLTNREATLGNVREALLDFLGKAAKDDLVVVFFAGHGAPDPGRLDELYLLVHDTDPTRMATTGLPMAEVSRALQRLRAERIVFFADACHSAGVTMPGIRLRSVGESNPINKMLKELAQVRRNRVVVTSSDVNQTSLEGAKWKHGVFTWALLEALGGAADVAGNKDGIVQLGEAVDFVRRTVEDQTLSRQTPVVAGEYDGRLPLALVRADAAVAPPATAPAPRPAVTTTNAMLDLGELVVEPRHTRPQAFFILQRRDVAVSLSADERAAAPAAATAFDAWTAASLAERRLQEDRARELRRLDDKLRPRLEAKDATAEAAYKRERTAIEKKYAASQAPLDKRAASTQIAAITAIEQALQAKPSIGSLYVALAELYFRRANDAYLSASEAYEKALTAGDVSQPEPMPDFAAAAAILARFLESFPKHPLRAGAHYFRTYLSSEAREPPKATAGYGLAAIAEFPDHQFGPDLYLLVGDTYFDNVEPRLLSLARETYLAGFQRAPSGHPLRTLFLYKLAWTHYRMDELAPAAQRFAELVDEKADAGVDLKPEAQAYLSTIIAETNDTKLADSLALPAPLKAAVFADASSQIAADNDDVTALAWIERALALAPAHADAPEWDARAIKLLEQTGKNIAAAERLEKRFEKYGPASTWYRDHRSNRKPDFLKGLAADTELAVTLRKAPPTLPVSTKQAALSFARRLVPGIGRCAERELKRDPRFQTKLTIELEWSATGEIKASRTVAPESTSKSLVDCVDARLANGRVNASQAGAARVSMAIRPSP